MVNLIEMAERRDKIMEKLGKGLLILSSLPEATYSNDVEFKFRQHTDVLYFTGFPEPATTCILENDGDKVVYHIFVRKRDKLMETWNGRRFGTEGALEKFNADMAYENGELEKTIMELQDNYPDKIRAFIRYDENLAHKIYSGADMILIPSRYEPCGLTQMIAMRYGCIPLAADTGGLKDSVTDIKTGHDSATGFLFPRGSSKELEKVMNLAINLFSERAKWKELQS